MTRWKTDSFASEAQCVGELARALIAQHSGNQAPTVANHTASETREGREKTRKAADPSDATNKTSPLRLGRLKVVSMTRPATRL